MWPSAFELCQSWHLLTASLLQFEGMPCLPLVGDSNCSYKGAQPSGKGWQEGVAMACTGSFLQQSRGISYDEGFGHPSCRKLLPSEGIIMSCMRCTRAAGSAALQRCISPVLD